MADVEQCFAELGEVELLPGRDIDTDSLRGADILLVRSVTRVDAALVAGSQLRFVGSATSGIDHVDQDMLRAKNIPFAWAPGSNADSVVDYVLSAIASCADKLERLLHGEALGIVGYGHIGRRLHQRMAALGIKVRAFDPWLSAETYPVLEDLASVLDSEVVTLHAELTQRQPHPSFHLLDRDTLEALRCGSLLISAGRGEVIDTEQLLDMHRQGLDCQLVLDVWENEPLVPLALLERCLFGTAHIAGYSTDGKRRATRMLFDACVESLQMNVSAGCDDGGSALAVEVTGDLHGAQLIRFLMLQIYDIAEDDRLLRQTVPGSFDGLRKSYRSRRELQLLQISNFDDLSPAQQQLCSALGCGAARC